MIPAVAQLHLVNVVCFSNKLRLSFQLFIVSFEVCVEVNSDWYLHV